MVAAGACALRRDGRRHECTRRDPYSHVCFVEAVGIQEWL